MSCSTACHEAAQSPSLSPMVRHYLLAADNSALQQAAASAPTGAQGCTLAAGSGDGAARQQLRRSQLLQRSLSGSSVSS